MNVCLSYLHRTSSEHEVSGPRKERAELIKEKALSCQAVRDLYELAKSTPGPYGQKGDISLEFAEKLNIPQSTKSYAEYVPEERRIYLKDDISDDKALSAFIFELTNVINYPKHEKNQSDVANFKIECRKYAKETERIEYEGTILHHQVVQKAIHGMRWPKSMDRWGERRVEDFEAHWATTISKSDHALSYCQDALLLRIKRVSKIAFLSIVALGCAVGLSRLF